MSPHSIFFEFSVYLIQFSLLVSNNQVTLNPSISAIWCVVFRHTWTFQISPAVIARSSLRVISPPGKLSTSRWCLFCSSSPSCAMVESGRGHKTANTQGIERENVPFKVWKWDKGVDVHLPQGQIHTYVCASLSQSFLSLPYYVWRVLQSATRALNIVVLCLPQWVSLDWFWQDVRQGYPVVQICPKSDSQNLDW